MGGVRNGRVAVGRLCKANGVCRDWRRDDDELDDAVERAAVSRGATTTAMPMMRPRPWPHSRDLSPRRSSLYTFMSC